MPWFRYLMFYKWIQRGSSILLHSGLNPAWHSWLPTRFSCCLNMKSVENILGYIRGQFCTFSRGSRKYPKMFKAHILFRENQCQAWSCYYVLLHFGVIFNADMRQKLLRYIINTTWILNVTKGYATILVNYVYFDD